MVDLARPGGAKRSSSIDRQAKHRQTSDTIRIYNIISLESTSKLLLRGRGGTKHTEKDGPKTISSTTQRTPPATANAKGRTAVLTAISTARGYCHRDEDGSSYQRFETSILCCCRSMLKCPIVVSFSSNHTPQPFLDPAILSRKGVLEKASGDR